MKPWINTTLTLVVAAALSAALLWGGDRLTSRLAGTQSAERVKTTFGDLITADSFEALDTKDVKEITEAWTARDKKGKLVGYALTVEVRGYGGPITVHTAFNADGVKLHGIRIGKHQETAGYGARITNVGFTEQFAEKHAPFYLSGGRVTWRDGVYRAAAEEYDSSGFRDVVELTIENGEITAVGWDGEHKDGGKTKKQLSRGGEYVMTEHGLPWHAQAEILELVLLDTQDPSKIVYNAETGKTDAYSGASIRISPFVTLVTQALGQAGGVEGTAIDGLSGATVSSRAVVDAVNTATAFLAEVN